MTGDQKNIDKLFRDGLKGIREKAPVHAWNRLDHALDGARHRRKLVYYRLAAASVLILMAFGAGYYYATFVNNPEVIVKEEPSIQPAPSTPTDTFKEVPGDDMSVAIEEGIGFMNGNKHLFVFAVLKLSISCSIKPFVGVIYSSPICHPYLSYLSQLEVIGFGNV